MEPVLKVADLIEFSMIGDAHIRIGLNSIRHCIDDEINFRDATTASTLLDVILTNIVFLIKSNEDRLYILLNSLTRMIQSFQRVYCHLLAVINKDRIAEILLLLMNSQSSCRNKLSGCRVLCEVLRLTDDKLVMFYVVQEAIKFLMRANATMDLCTLVSLSLRYALIENEDQVLNYIMSNVKLLLEKVGPIQDVLPFLHCISEIYYCKSNFPLSNTLFGVMDKIAKYSCSALLAEVARKVLLRILVDFMNNIGEDFQLSHEEVGRLVDQLPKNLKEWTLPEHDVFFVVVHIQHLHNCLIWTKQRIIKSLVVRLCSRSYIHPTILKSLCYLYPILLDDTVHVIPKEELCAAESSLLELVLFCPEPKLIDMKCSAQLRWIFNSSVCVTFKAMLCGLLLNEYQDDAMLTDITRQSQAGEAFLTFIMKEKDDQLSKRAARIVGTLNDKQLSEKVRDFIFNNHDDVPIIARLLLAKPSVPEDNKKGSLLNKLIIMTIPYLLEDDEVFYAACRYSRKCMLHLQDNPYIVRVFYNTPYTVNTVLRIALQRDDDLGCCAVKLLYVSVKLQRIGRLVCKNKTMADLSKLLGTHEQRTTISFELLKQVLSCKEDSYIKNKDSSFFGLYIKLHDFVHTKFKTDAYHCMLKILYLRPSYAYSSLTEVTIEAQCENIAENPYSESFLMFVKKWTSIVEMSNTLSDDVVKGYISRAPVNIKSKVRKLFQDSVELS